MWLDDGGKRRMKELNQHERGLRLEKSLSRFVVCGCLDQAKTQNWLNMMQDDNVLSRRDTRRARLGRDRSRKEAFAAAPAIPVSLCHHPRKKSPLLGKYEPTSARLRCDVEMLRCHASEASQWQVFCYLCFPASSPRSVLLGV